MIGRFFIKLLNMSLTAGLIILAVLLARIILKKAPKVFSCALWAVVLFRLLCPISFPSAVSFLGVFHLPAAQQGGIEYIKENNLRKPQAGNLTDPAGDHGGTGMLSGNGEEKASPYGTAVTIGAWIWLAGLLALAVYSAVSFARFKRTLDRAVRDRDNVYISADVTTPFVIGIFRPRIYLPSFLNEEEKEYIVLHERIHIKRGDPIIKIISWAALCLHWFNPLVWAAFFLSGRDMEMSCDEAVIRKMGDGVKKGYSVSLLTLATGIPIINGVPLAFGEGDTGSRIKHVLKYRKPALLLICAAAAATLCAAVLLLANPKTVSSNGEDIYYGIIMDMELEGGSRRVVSIPRLGEVEIPESSNITPWFETPDFELEAGDLIKISFGEGNDVELQETYPASFSSPAESIVAIAGGMALSYEGEDRYLFTFPFGALPEESQNAQTGDTLEISAYDEADENSAMVLLTEAEIVTASAAENRICIRLKTEDLEKVLSGYGFHIYFKLQDSFGALLSQDAPEGSL